MRVYFTYFEPHSEGYYQSYHITSDIADILSVDFNSKKIANELKGISEDGVVEENRVFMSPELALGVKDETQALFCSHIDMVGCSASIPYYGYIRGASRAPTLYKGGLVVTTLVFEEHFDMIHVVIDPRNLPSVIEAEETGEYVYKRRGGDYLDEDVVSDVLQDSEHLISVASTLLRDGYYHNGRFKQELK